MTRLQETERAYLVAKLEWLTLFHEEGGCDEHGLVWCKGQYDACEKRLYLLDEEIAR